MSFSSKTFVIILWLLLVGVVAAQDDSPIVPNLNRLNPAQAAAILNSANLLLGKIDYREAVPSDEEQPAYRILAQSPAVGSTVDAGTAVDITLNYYNVLLRYDGNEFHLINLSAVAISLDNLVFKSGEREYRARQWGDTLDIGECVQAWIINVANFHRPDECATVQGGIGVQRNLPAAQQFWLGTDDVTTFTIVQNDFVRGECPTATDPEAEEPRDTCPLWIASQQPPEDFTEYGYFVYDDHHFYVYNRSTAQWMPLAQITIADTPRPLTESRFFDVPPRGDINWLAPGQCLHIHDGTPLAEDAVPIADCDEVIQATYIRGDRFWLDGFTLNGVLDVPSQRGCPPVAGSERTICLIPR